MRTKTDVLGMKRLVRMLPIWSPRVFEIRARKRLPGSSKYAHNLPNDAKPTSEERKKERKKEKEERLFFFT